MWNGNIGESSPAVQPMMVWQGPVQPPKITLSVRTPEKPKVAAEVNNDSEELTLSKVAKGGRGGVGSKKKK